MKIAYIIVAHKYPEQLLRLISQLNTDDVAFFVHIDKKVDNKIYHQIFTQLKDFPYVYFIKRYRSAWASFELVKATLEGIKLIVETGTYFDYVVHLSGQDYLIKSNEQIAQFFQENKGREFLEYFPLPCTKWGDDGLGRVEHWHIRWNDRYLFCIPPVKREFKSPIASFLHSVLILSLPKKRKFFESFSLYGGSAHWCLTGECVKWIDDFVKQNTKFVNRFNYTSCADEIFYQTLILNSPFKDKIINDDLKYMEWPYVNALHPRNLEKKDFEKIRESGKLFARKFDLTVDADILDMIDEMILSK